MQESRSTALTVLIVLAAFLLPAALAGELGCHEVSFQTFPAPPASHDHPCGLVRATMRPATTSAVVLISHVTGLLYALPLPDLRELIGAPRQAFDRSTTNRIRIFLENEVFLI